MNNLCPHRFQSFVLHTVLLLCVPTKFELSLLWGFLCDSSVFLPAPRSVHVRRKEPF